MTLVSIYYLCLMGKLLLAGYGYGVYEPVVNRMGFVWAVVGVRLLKMKL